MFVLELTYTAPLERVDAVAPDHLAWLDENFAAGRLILAGRKNPRDGGILLAVVDNREAAEALVAADPYTTAGVCEYRIVEFTATRTAPALTQYKANPPS